MAKTKADLMKEIETLTIKLRTEIARGNSLQRRLSLAQAARKPWMPVYGQRQKELFP
jgi:hypothetical protein